MLCRQRVWADCRSSGTESGCEAHDGGGSWYGRTVNVEIVTTVLSAVAVLIGVWRMLAKTEDRLGARIDRVETGLNKRIDRLEDRLDQRIDRLDQRIDAVLLADRRDPPAA